MALTLNDVVERLKQIDEVSLMEMLEISSEDMVSRFLDRVEMKYDILLREFEEDEEDTNEPWDDWAAYENKDND